MLNLSKTKENPEYVNGINDMIHFWLEADGVAGGIRGDDIYDSKKVRNVEVDDGGKEWGEGWDNFSIIDAHSFINFPTLFNNTVKSQKVKPLKPINSKKQD